VSYDEPIAPPRKAQDFAIAELSAVSRYASAYRTQFGLAEFPAFDSQAKSGWFLNEQILSKISVKIDDQLCDRNFRSAFFRPWRVLSPKSLEKQHFKDMPDDQVLLYIQSENPRLRFGILKMGWTRRLTDAEYKKLDDRAARLY
jgi:hypothetical protein